MSQDSDSDATVLCTDEEGAKLYEMPDTDSDFDTFSNATLESAQSTNGTKRRYIISKRASSRSKPSDTAKRSRPVRQSRRPARVSDVFTDLSESDDDFQAEVYPKPTPTVRTRTRAAYQTTQSSFWTLEDVMSEMTDNASAASKGAAATAPTPEQLELRQKRIERRKEAARLKMEKEMRETVERLLRINTSYGDGNGGGKGRGRNRGTARVRSDSEDSNGEKKKRNALHPSLPLDPSPGSIRFISSQRTQPHCMVILPPRKEGVLSPLEVSYQPRRAPSPPELKLCDQCKVAPRKYACPKTGRSLCSLECFRAG